MIEKDFVNDVNQTAAFLAKRDVAELTTAALQEKYQINQADVLMVFGNDLPYVMEAASKAFQKGIAKQMILCGGVGHSTKRLRKAVGCSEKYPWDEKELGTLSEAEIYGKIAVEQYGISAEYILLEKESTNSGENARNGLALAKQKGIELSSIILMQDPLLQRRADATLRPMAKGTIVMSYAPFLPTVQKDGSLNGEIAGLWNEERMLGLMFGEILRLYDDEYGYGPRGKGFIAHVEIPEEVMQAAERLKKAYPQISRDKKK